MHEPALLPPGTARIPSPRYRQIHVPPLGCGGLVVSRTAASEEQADFEHLRTTYADSIVPWDTRPDLATVDDVLAWLQRRALPGSDALDLKRRMICDLVERSRSYKSALLDRVLEESGFWNAIEKRWRASGKPQHEFSVLIKPNTMMVWSRYEVDPANTTDPELVLHLIDRLRERGYTRIVVAEAQNVYSHWYCVSDAARGRTAIEVHGWEGVGYPIDAEGFSVGADGARDGRFGVVDLTLDAEGHSHAFDKPIHFLPRTSARRWLSRVVPCAKRRVLGGHPLAPTLRDADFRISFPVNKTHTSCFNTLTLKNVYGCFPYANKFLEYHCKRDFDWPTCVLLREYPFHFGIVDAVFSADGVLGFKADYFPRMTRTIIAGEDLVAVDIVGSLKMGLDPRRSRIIWLAAQVFGFPIDRIRWLADDKEPYPGWINIPRRYDWVQYWGEKWYWISSYLGQATSEMDPYFTARPSADRDRALAGQRVYTRFVRPALNVVEGWGRTRRWRWLWRPADRPGKLRRKYAKAYEG